MVFQYKKAVCREIPRSIVEEGLRMEQEADPFCYESAVKQHNEYVKTLKSLGLDVTVLKADESLPDCVFVEDPVIVIDDTVLVNNPGAPSRKAERNALKKHFMENEPSKKIVEMTSPAELDGGDVLFTGREIFVGISDRTNEAGVETVRKTFSNYTVHMVDVGNKTLHLKSMMGMGGEDVIVCGKSDDASLALKLILEKATHIYDVIRAPNDFGANTLPINGKLLCQGPSDFPESYEAISKLSIGKIPLSNKELNKIDGCLSCISVLYN